MAIHRRPQRRGTRRHTAGGPRLSQAAVRHLALAGHRLRPWPDARDALRRLADRFTIVALSNGNLSMLTNLFTAAGLTWHCVLSGEMVHAYKPDPAVYRFAVDSLALDPPRTFMVAAHARDLRAAAVHGLRTAYIERAGEGEPEPSDTFDRAIAYQDVTTLVPASKLRRSIRRRTASRSRRTREMRHDSMSDRCHPENELGP